MKLNYDIARPKLQGYFDNFDSFCLVVILVIIMVMSHRSCNLFALSTRKPLK